MSEQFIDVDTDEFIDAPKALRDAYKQLKGRYTEVASERDAFKGQATSAALGGVLREFKNPERVQRDLLSDKVDPLDSEAVAKWLESNAGDYARGDGSSAQSQISASDTAEQDAHRRLQSGGELRQPADMSKLEAANAEITPDMDGKAVAEVYRRHGI